MFLKKLIIATGNGAIIRDIPFHPGLNLIVDETPVASGKETGNNVGKTTVLKLIDFCFGADAREIYSDSENKRNEYREVKTFLVGQRVLISLVLKDDLAAPGSREVVIERNFLSRRNRIQRIDGRALTDEEFDEALTSLLFPGHYGKKPTFRQIISHNIRYKDISVNNTLKTLDRYTKEDEYETLDLFLLGCDFDQGDAKQNLRAKIDLEEKYKRRLESTQTRSGYETALALLQSEIVELERRRAALNLNPNFEADLERLNQVKYQVNVAASEISRLEIRRDLIREAQREMERDVSTVDLQQLRQIYDQATTLVSGIQKTFQELHAFHNQMVASKIRFIVQELPKIEGELETRRTGLQRGLADEAALNATIIQGDSFAELEQLVVALNLKFQKKGELETVVRQLSDVDAKLTAYNNELKIIDEELFSEGFLRRIQDQVNKFNQHFAAVSTELYGEQYALKVDIKLSKGRRLYVFSAFNTNFSSGKKQGEISCFDIAYTLFADDEEIPCMHFLLNDKKELMHDNQLLRIAQLVNAKGIQFVASILTDKLPDELRADQYCVLKLSQQDKLFRI